MVGRLNGKVALITGGSSGIGLTTATLFAKEGAKVTIASRSEEKGRSGLNEIRSSSGLDPMWIHANVSRSDDVRRMIQTVLEKFGRLDILFCNAGINSAHSIIETTEENWNDVIANNLTSVFLCCKYALPYMMRQRGGSIICTGSTYSFVGHQNFTAYSASKGGILTFAKSLALEMAKYNIRVNCVCPSTIETSMVKQGWIESGNPEKMRESRLKLHPIGRIGTPEDVAQAVVYLASDESSFITGSELLIDGGYTAQ